MVHTHFKLPASSRTVTLEIIVGSPVVRGTSVSHGFAWVSVGRYQAGKASPCMQSFPVASRRINELMPVVLRVLQRTPVLARGLFQVLVVGLHACCQICIKALGSVPVAKEVKLQPTLGDMEYCRMLMRTLPSTVLQAPLTTPPFS